MSDQFEVIVRHVSPDGELTFVVHRTSDGIVFGFDGYGWHLHPETFERNGRDDVQIALDVVDDLINDRSIVVIAHWPDETEYRILDSLEFEVDLKLADEELAFRFWSGKRVSIEDLIDRNIVWKPLGERLN